MRGGYVAQMSNGFHSRPSDGIEGCAAEKEVHFYVTSSAPRSLGWSERPNEMCQVLYSAARAGRSFDANRSLWVTATVLPDSFLNPEVLSSRHFFPSKAIGS